MARWIPENEQFVRDNYGRMSFGEMAARLGMTRSQVSGKMDRLGLSSGTPRSQRHKVNLPQRRGTPFRQPLLQSKPYEEKMPQLTGDEKLHSRTFGDLEPGMCYYPLYVEQGVQMYCAAQTNKLPGRFDTYCPCHREMSQQPRAERQNKYKRGIWAR